MIDLHLSDQLLAPLWRDSFSSVGFCRLVNHSLDGTALSEKSAQFFRLSEKEKAKASAMSYGLNGFSAVGKEAVGREKADPVESLVFNRGGHDASDVPKELCDEAWKYYEHSEALVRRLMRITAISLNWNEDFFDESFKEPSCALRIANYKPSLVENGEFLYAEHTGF